MATGAIGLKACRCGLFYGSAAMFRALPLPALHVVSECNAVTHRSATTYIRVELSILRCFIKVQTTHNPPFTIDVGSNTGQRKVKLLRVIFSNSTAVNAE